VNATGIGIAESVLEADGIRLHRLSLTPPGVPLASLLIVHGLSDHSARYESAARTLAAAGIAVQTWDLRGHGRSGGARGYARRFDVLLQDVDRVRRVVADEMPPDVPLFLLGHSLGGLIAIRYLEEHPDRFRGGVIVSPWLGTVVEPPAWKVGLARVLSRVAPRVPFRAGIPTAFLSHDPAIGPRFQADPFAHDTITPRLWTEVTGAIDLAFARADRIRVPVLFLLAGDDRIVDTERSRELGASIPGDRADLRVLEGRYHEILNETDAADSLAAIAAWIRDRADSVDPAG
jgi:alpha-beta hydrolase superfamily lysophospholipase